MTAAFVLGGIGFALALLLSLARRLLASREAGTADQVVNAIDALLPQTPVRAMRIPGLSALRPSRRERRTARSVPTRRAGDRHQVEEPAWTRVGRRRALTGAHRLRRKWRASSPRTASAARCVSTRAPWMPSSVPRPTCMQSSKSTARGANCACHRAPWTASSSLSRVRASQRHVRRTSTADGGLHTFGVGMPKSAQIIERIEAAGIVGMGGGGYPTARKIREAVAANADWVIGNGMASEPGVTADAALAPRTCRRGDHRSRHRRPLHRRDAHGPRRSSRQRRPGRYAGRARLSQPVRKRSW